MSLIENKVHEEKFNTVMQLFNNPNFHKNHSPDEVYSCLDAINSEIFEEDIHRHSDIDFVCVLPPLFYENKFIKGVCYTQASDTLLKLFPNIQEIFHVISLSMTCAFPRQNKADAIFSLYRNEEREAWFKKTYPNRKDGIFIPLEDSDFTHEYVMQPRHEQEKKYDIIMVSRIAKEKNLLLIADALKIYREKYKKDLKVVWYVGKEIDPKFTGLNESEKNILLEMSSILNSSNKFIDIVGHADYNEMPKNYSQAKICLLSSLCEGKNRSIREAMLCDVPILLFKDFIKYVRGQNDIIPNFEGNAGYSIEHFSASSLADSIEYMLNNLETYSPRKTYLESMGRKNFFNIVLNSFNYYEQNVPNYAINKAYNNAWLDLAIADNYQLSLNDFLYSRNLALQASKGLEGMKKLANFYQEKYMKHKVGA